MDTDPEKSPRRDRRGWAWPLPAGAVVWAVLNAWLVGTLLAGMVVLVMRGEVRWTLAFGAIVVVDLAFLMWVVRYFRRRAGG